MKPQIDRLRKCLTFLPDMIIYGERWHLKDGDYVLSDETTTNIYKAPGREHFFVHDGLPDECWHGSTVEFKDGAWRCPSCGVDRSYAPELWLDGMKPVGGVAVAVKPPFDLEGTSVGGVD